MEAIVYTSNAGHTKAYAELLGQETGLPVYSLKEAAARLPRRLPVIYLGWLMAGQVRGLKKAQGLFNVRIIAGVGMAPNGSQVDDIRRSNPISGGIPVFSLQGGLDIGRLHGIYRLMMTVMKNTAGKKLQERSARTPQEEEMLQLMLSGRDTVSRDNLTELLACIGRQPGT